MSQENLTQELSESEAKEQKNKLQTYLEREVQLGEWDTPKLGQPVELVVMTGSGPVFVGKGEVTLLGSTGNFTVKADLKKVGEMELVCSHYDLSTNLARVPDELRRKIIYSPLEQQASRLIQKGEKIMDGIAKVLAP